jgi:hypothetical protein
MPTATDDLQMLRLIKACQRVKDEVTRRKIVAYVEEEARRDEASRGQSRPS